MSSHFAFLGSEPQSEILHFTGTVVIRVHTVLITMSLCREPVAPEALIRRDQPDQMTSRTRDSDLPVNASKDLGILACIVQDKLVTC